MRCQIDEKLAIEFALTLRDYVHIKEFLRQFLYGNLTREEWPDWYEFLQRAEI